MSPPKLMVLLGVVNISGSQGTNVSTGAALSLAVCLHTLAMLVVMACIAWIVYKKLGLMVLKRSWINFDLIWAGALLLVGGIALYSAI